MESLYDRKKYPADLALDIEKMGSVAVSIANRWLLGWPARVKVLLATGVYFESLKSQLEQETAVLAAEPNLRHLAAHEIRALYELREAPPRPPELEGTP